VPLIREIRQRVGKVEFTVPPFQPGDADAVEERPGVVAAPGKQTWRASCRARRPRRGEGIGARRMRPGTRAPGCGKCSPTSCAAVERLRGRFYSDLQRNSRCSPDKRDRPMTVADVTPELRRMLVGKTGKFLVRVFPRRTFGNGNHWSGSWRMCSRCPQRTGTPWGCMSCHILVRGYIKRRCGRSCDCDHGLCRFAHGDGDGVDVGALVVGTIWLIGVMAVCGIRFNPSNILALPLMVGSGRLRNLHCSTISRGWRSHVLRQEHGSRGDAVGRDRGESRLGV